MPEVELAFDDGEYFESRARRVLRDIVFSCYREHALEQGRSRRSVSGSTGRLLHDLSDSAIHVVRDRLEQDLPLSCKNSITRTHDLLQRMWNVPLPANDSTYLQSMGEACDPSSSEVLQQFQRPSSLRRLPEGLLLRKPERPRMSFAMKSDTCSIYLQCTCWSRVFRRRREVSSSLGLSTLGSSGEEACASSGAEGATGRPYLHQFGDCVGKTCRRWKCRQGFCHARRMRRRHGRRKMQFSQLASHFLFFAYNALILVTMGMTAFWLTSSKDYAAVAMAGFVCYVMESWSALAPVLSPGYAQEEDSARGT